MISERDMKGLFTCGAIFFLVVGAISFALLWKLGHWLFSHLHWS